MVISVRSGERVYAYDSNILISHRIHRHHHDLLRYRRRPPNAVPALTEDTATDWLVLISVGGTVVVALVEAAIDLATSAVISSMVTDDASRWLLEVVVVACCLSLFARTLFFSSTDMLYHASG